MHRLDIVDVDPKYDLICCDIGQLCDARELFLQHLKLIVCIFVIFFSQVYQKYRKKYVNIIVILSAHSMFNHIHLT